MKLNNKSGGKDGAGVPFRVLRFGNAYKVCLYFILVSFIAFLSGDVNVIFAQAHPDVMKYTLNVRRTATTDESPDAQEIATNLSLT
jgi:hypothetical protein